ncbi:MAG: ABC transporter ATPase [Sphingobacteriaceae bacterium]
MEFSLQSRVWIYQSDKELSLEETALLQDHLDQFAARWTAHNNQLKANAEIRYNRFIVLIVDESQAGASGCSIDKSVSFIKQLEKQYGLNFFDRFNIAYRKNGAIVSVNRDAFEQLLTEGEINAETPVFNNVVQTLGELQQSWEIPLRKSWHARVFSDLLQAQ